MKIIGKKIWSLIASLSTLFFQIIGIASTPAAQQGEIGKTPQEIRTTPKELRGSPGYFTPSAAALKNLPSKIICSPKEGKALSFLIGGQWTLMPDKSFQKTDQLQNRLVIKEGGETNVFDRSGKLIFSRTDPVAAEVHKALVKSMEMLEKSK